MRSTINVTVEVPRGSRNTYAYDLQLDAILFDGVLPSSMTCPVDAGFVPDTRATDDDLLDALVLVSDPTFPGCVIPAHPVALFRMTGPFGPDDKLLCVPSGDPHWNHVADLRDLPRHLLAEIAHFFSVVEGRKGRRGDADGWHPVGRALEILGAARDRWAAPEDAGGS